jgi:hypothetical protein
MQICFRNSTFRITGAYLGRTSSPKFPAWNSRMLALQGDGWGIAALFFGLSRHTFTHQVQKKDKNGNPVVDANNQPVMVDAAMNAKEIARRDNEMTAAGGVADAGKARAFALKAGLRPGSIYWLDNEDAGIQFVQTELDYYAAFFNEISSAAGGKAAFHPAVYAHSSMAAQLLLIRPDLHVWETDYGDRHPKVRGSFRGDSRFGLEPDASAMEIKGFSVGAGGSTQPYTAWPLLRQLANEPKTVLPPRPISGLAPVSNWDWNSALVRDPLSASATPGLRACTIGGAVHVCRLDDIDPHVNTVNGAQDLPRRGRLRVYPPPYRNGAEITGPSTNLHYQTPIVVLPQDVPEIIALSVLNEPHSATMDKQWSPLTRLWKRDLAPKLRFPFAIDACQTRQMKYLFFAVASGQLYAARRSGTGVWDDSAVAGGKLVLHPFGALCACTRGDTVHALTFNDAGVLVELRWKTSEKIWPSQSVIPITTTPPFPFPASVVAAAPSPSELIVVAIGTDHRPWRYVLRGAPGKEAWTPAAPLGRVQDVITAHSSLALSVVDATSVDLVAMGGDGIPQRYALARKDNWIAIARSPVIKIDRSQGTPENPLPAASFPNPHSGLSSAKAAGATPVIAFAGGSAGQVAAFVSLQPDSTIRMGD